MKMAMSVLIWNKIIYRRASHTI